MAEPRARRTHARRSCDLCKVRKTRCELPDLDVPAGPTPLPTDKSCHRCRVLALPCVVDDGGARKRKRKDDGAGGPGASGGSPASARARTGGAADGGAAGALKRAPAARKRKSEAADGLLIDPAIADLDGTEPLTAPLLANVVNHSLDLFQGFSPVPGASPGQASPGIGPPVNRSLGTTSNKAASIRLHGRPLELVGAMLSVAHAKDTAPIRRRDVVVDNTDLGELVDAAMRDKLANGYAQLRTYHPHLQALPELFRLQAAQSAPSINLLLATTVYLSTFALPPDAPVRQLRAALAPVIGHLQSYVTLRCPPSFHALQALEVLAVHAPFGSLPFTLTDTRALLPARGYVVAMTAISSAVAFAAMLINISRGGQIYHQWANQDYWLWLGMIAAEAQFRLEDDLVRVPERLAEARHAVDLFTRPDMDSFWRGAVDGVDHGELFGRATMCDRIARLGEVHDALVKMRQILEEAAANDKLDVVEALSLEHDAFLQRMEHIDQKHVNLMGILDLPRAITSGWVSYRKIRRKFEVSRVFVVGLHMFMAAQFLPNTPFAFPDLPHHKTPLQAAAYAINRSYNPDDMMAVIQSTTPASEGLKRWGRRRGEVAERVLIAYAELASAVQHQPGGPRRYTDIVPLHETTAIVVECAKVLMEMQAGSVIALRSIGAVHRAFKIPTWVYVMREVAEFMRAIAQLCVDDGGGGASVTSGCSNLLGSMCRTADEWARHVDSEGQHESAALPPSAGQAAVPMPGAADPGERETLLRGYGGMPHAPSASLGQYIVVGDRWLSDDAAPGGPAPPVQPAADAAAAGPASAYTAAPATDVAVHPTSLPMHLQSSASMQSSPVQQYQPPPPNYGQNTLGHMGGPPPPPQAQEQPPYDMRFWDTTPQAHQPPMQPDMGMPGAAPGGMQPVHQPPMPYQQQPLSALDQMLSEAFGYGGYQQQQQQQSPHQQQPMQPQHVSVWPPS